MVITRSNIGTDIPGTWYPVVNKRIGFIDLCIGIRVKPLPSFFTTMWGRKENVFPNTQIIDS